MAKKKKVKIKPYPIASVNNIIPLTIDERIGIVSDMHIGSKFSRKESLLEAYDMFEDAGVKQVFNAGDITDGWMVYPGQVVDQNNVGYESQANEVKKKYPKKKNINTNFIMGNHDASFMKRTGADICKYIGAIREDLDYAGAFYARFQDPDDDVTLDLVHPDGGSPYSISYGMQKYLRNQPPSHYPDMLVNGHRHQSFYGYYQEVHTIEAGCFQDPSDFTIRKGYCGNVGCWMVDMERVDGRIKKFKPEYISFNGNVGGDSK